MRRLLTKIIAITLLCAVALSISWIVYSINKSNKEIPKSAKLVKNIEYDYTKGGITYI